MMEGDNASPEIFTAAPGHDDKWLPVGGARALPYELSRVVGRRAQLVTDHVQRHRQRAVGDGLGGCGAGHIMHEQMVRANFKIKAFIAELPQVEVTSDFRMRH